MNYQDRKELFKQQREADYQIGQIMEKRYKDEILAYFNINENENNIKIKHSRYGTIVLRLRTKRQK